MPKEITHWLIASEVLQRLGWEDPSAHNRHAHDMQHQSSEHSANHNENNEYNAAEAFKHPNSPEGFQPTHTTLLDSASFDTAITLLGASYHDVMYYVPRHADTPAFTNAADYLHGTRGEDTFELFRLLAKDYLRAETESQHQEQRLVRSFLLGALTHYCTDTIFHPSIYWSSGNWHGKGLFAAQRHHRALESALDLYFLTTLPLSVLSSGSSSASSSQSSASQSTIMLDMMDTLLQRRHKELSILSMLLARHTYWHHWKSLGTKTVANAIVRGYKNLATARRWSQRHIANAIVRLLEPHLSLRLQSLTALRYESRWLRSFHAAFPHGDIEFLHPCTGERTSSTFDAMFESAVNLSLRYWTEIDGMLQQKNIPFSNLVGASLEVGLVETPASAMQHFCAKPVPTFW